LIRSVISTGTDASCCVGELAGTPAALAVSGIAAAVPATDAMNVRRLNPEMVLEGGRSDIDGLRRYLNQKAHACAFCVERGQMPEVPGTNAR
jgi:hypothetical protein